MFPTECLRLGEYVFRSEICVFSFDNWKLVTGNALESGNRNFQAEHNLPIVY
jgi:hypothetical protein